MSLRTEQLCSLWLAAIASADKATRGQALSLLPAEKVAAALMERSGCLVVVAKAEALQADVTAAAAEAATDGVYELHRSRRLSWLRIL